MFDSIGFDLDGTLWSSMNCITSSWQSVAEEYKFPLPTDEQIRSVMGLNKIDLMNKLFPGADKALAEQFFNDATVACVEELRQRGGILYDGVEETLAELSKHYRRGVGRQPAALFFHIINSENISATLLLRIPKHFQRAKILRKCLQSTALRIHCTSATLRATGTPLRLQKSRSAMPPTDSARLTVTIINLTRSGIY